jgi:N-acetylglucosamine-6-phosphate deacetylase
LAPEEAGSDEAAARLIKSLRSRGIVVSVGHSAATDAQMRSAVHAGASMITHLFNAMSSPHHRDTGIFGMLGRTDDSERPFFGIIADDIHVAPNMVRVAYNAHPAGCILVTDAMAMVGMADGEYENFPWTQGATIVKKGNRLSLKGIEGSIAGR